MTDAPVLGVSQVFSPPTPAIETMSSEQAAAHIESLKDNPQFADRLARGDTAARDEWFKAWARKSGNDLPPPQTPEGVYAQQEQRVAAEAETHGNFLRARGLTDIEIFQIQNGRPAPIEERRFFEARWEALKNDRAWFQRWQNGDADAIAEQTRIAHALRMRVGTVAECELWDKDHPFPGGSVRVA